MPCKKKCTLAPRLALITVLAWYCHPLLAEQIVMLNGDIITGTVKTIWDEKLTIEPAYADDFKVDLDAVSFIESERVFDIEFTDGREVKARMLGGNAGMQRIEIDGEVREIPLMQFAKLDEPADYYDWDTFIDLNSTVEKGNTDSEKVALKVKTNLKLGDHRHIGELTLARESQSGVPPRNRNWRRTRTTGLSMIRGSWPATSAMKATRSNNSNIESLSAAVSVTTSGMTQGDSSRSRPSLVGKQKKSNGKIMTARSPAGFYASATI